MTPVLCVFGTRPEAIKMAPVVDRPRETGAPYRVAVTAQHRATVLAPRTVTERPEGVDAGAALLTGVERTAIGENTLRLIDDVQTRKARMVERSPYGDGQSAGRIVHALANRYLGGSDAVEQAS